MPIYEHRQFGTAILFLLLAPTILFAITMSLVANASTMLPLLIIVLFLLFTALLFSSLTVRVDAREVTLFFGPGVLGRRIPLETIIGVRVVSNPIWMGLGIHFFRRGMIYNVSGRDGIEITLRNGRLVRIGSNEPAALARAVEDAVAQYAARR